MIQKYAIYLVEREVRPNEKNPSPQKGATHSFLAVTALEWPSQPRVIQELHFKNKGDTLTAVFGISAGHDHLIETMKKHEVLRGRKTTVQGVWAKACRTARQISALELEFSPTDDIDPNAINCRAGVRAVLKSVDLKFVSLNDTPHAQRGTKTDLLKLLPRSPA